jgi:predicted double-glycine peptidase
MRPTNHIYAAACLLFLCVQVATPTLADNADNVGAIPASSTFGKLVSDLVSDADLSAYRGGTAQQFSETGSGGLAQPRWVTIPGMIAGGSSANIKIISLKEQRFRTTVRQQYDYSCGSAALSTLLTQYKNPVSEQTIFKEMWNTGDQERIRREGFSLLDMKVYLQAKGYNANGYVASLDKLEEVGIPAIALINDNGYNHFVVVKGLLKDKVLVGDPSAGGRIMQRPEFEKLRLNGILLVIDNKRELAVFNAESDWQIRPKAPLGLAMSPDNLVNVGLLRRGPNDF